MKMTRFMLALTPAVIFLTGCATDSIEDRRTGQQIICHDGKKTLTVSGGSGHAHLQHGDTVGPCPVEN